MSRFEQALEQVRRAHQEDLNELPDDLHGLESVLASPPSGGAVAALPLDGGTSSSMPPCSPAPEAVSAVRAGTSNGRKLHMYLSTFRALEE